MASKICFLVRSTDEQSIIGELNSYTNFRPFCLCNCIARFASVYCTCVCCGKSIVTMQSVCAFKDHE